VPEGILDEETDESDELDDILPEPTTPEEAPSNDTASESAPAEHSSEDSAPDPTVTVQVEEQIPVEAA